MYSFVIVWLAHSRQNVLAGMNYLMNLLVGMNSNDLAGMNDLAD